MHTPGRELENHLGGAEARRYRDYQLSLIGPHLGRSVLEVGSGLGDFSAMITQAGRLVVSDTDPGCLDALRRRFDGDPRVDVLEVDLDVEVSLTEKVESVLAMNVLEHIEDDVAALRALGRLLVPTGAVVLWVPAYPALYGDFDRMVGHHRRYTPASLRATVEAAGLVPELLRPVNLLGGIAWWAAVRRGGAGTASERLVRAYDRLVIPLTRILERRWSPPFGQSLLCVARRR
ncbi:MAG: class I SAM-dependent methyltransferase [Mycobacteriales bacterium]